MWFEATSNHSYSFFIYAQDILVIEGYFLTSYWSNMWSGDKKNYDQVFATNVLPRLGLGVLSKCPLVSKNNMKPQKANFNHCNHVQSQLYG